MLSKGLGGPWVRRSLSASTVRPGSAWNSAYYRWGVQRGRLSNWLGIGRLERFGDVTYEIRSKLGIHREGQNLLRIFLRHGEAALVVSKILVCLLQVDRDGVVDTCRDTLLLEIVSYAIAVLGANDIQVVDRFSIFRFRRGHKGSASQVLLISLGMLTALLIPFVEVA